MRATRLLALAVALCACALGSARVEVLSREPSFRARTAALVSVGGIGDRGDKIASLLAKRLKSYGIKAVPIRSVDSVIAGSTLDLDVAGDPRVLAEIRRATGADSVVFVNVAPDARSLETTVLNARSGEAVLQARARPRGASFGSNDEIAAAAAQSLSSVALGRRAAAERDRAEELPPP